MSLNIDDLYGKHDQLIKLKKESYDKICNRCINMVKLSAKAGSLYCTFEIPNFEFGSPFPITDIESGAIYIMNNFEQSNKDNNTNIKTEFISPNMIFID